MTAVMVASKNGHQGVVEMLLKARVDTELHDEVLLYVFDSDR